MSARVLSILFAVSVLFAPALAAQTSSDEDIGLTIIKSINTYPRFTIFDDVSVSVEGGAVTLQGKVTMPFKRDEIASRIERIDGVRSVTNNIGVLPVSPFDDELRRKVARAIYGNSAFWQYAAMVNPPIHIVVENGRVTLTGVVATEVDRVLARSLATGHGGLSVTNELRTDAEVRNTPYRATGKDASAPQRQ
jgi:hyperosmotically inducible periplasmic protein